MGMDAQYSCVGWGNRCSVCGDEIGDLLEMVWNWKSVKFQVKEGI